MLTELVNRILELNDPQFVEINGRDYTNQSLDMIPEPMPVALKVQTLETIPTYIAECDYFDSEDDIFIHVEDFNTVSVFADLVEKTNQRPKYLECSFHMDRDSIAVTGSIEYMDIERFIINLRTNFIQTNALAEVIRLVGNVKDENIKTVADDGISQQVTVNSGVGRLDAVVIPNPVRLQPYRTFLEIEQPESLFLLRMRQGINGDMPECALFQADGGMWKLEAVKRIKAWLNDKISGTTIIG